MAEVKGLVRLMLRGLWKSKKDELEGECGRLMRINQQLLAEKAAAQEEMAALRQALAQAEEVAERLREQTRSFMSEISHEIRVPISIIKGYCDILNEGLVEDENAKRQYLVKIFEKTNDLNKIVTDLLFLGRLEDGSAEYNYTRWDLGQLLKRICSDYEIVMESKSTKVDINFSAEDLIMEADMVKIGQVINNVIENAIKYMGRSGNIRITASALDTREVMIVIKDDGLGMDSEEAQYIFERHYRGKSNREIGGTGLGLYIAKNIVEHHGGTIWAKSEKGAGMTVYLILPLSKKERRQSRPRPDQGADGHSQPS